MPERAGSHSPFTYLILRLVPSVERGECLNVGVVVFCRQRGFLRAKVELDPLRVAAVAPHAPVGEIADHLNALVEIAAGAAGAGPIAELPPSERFGWLAAPSSTMVQPSPVHTGLSDDPETTLEALFARLVISPGE